MQWITIYGHTFLTHFMVYVHNPEEMEMVRMYVCNVPLNIIYIFNKPCLSQVLTCLPFKISTYYLLDLGATLST